jgi:hypothetical protein
VRRRFFHFEWRPWKMALHSKQAGNCMSYLRLHDAILIGQTSKFQGRMLVAISQFCFILGLYG